MGKQKRVAVKDSFIQALQQKFETDKTSLKGSIRELNWKKQLAYLINRFIQKELALLDVDLHDRVYHKELNEWPSYKTIESMMQRPKKATPDLLKVCSWYIFGVNWDQKRVEFQVNEKEQYHIDITQVFKTYYIGEHKFKTIQISGDKRGQLGHLDMENFYVHLSYIEYKDLANRNTLIKKEQEKFSRRLEQSEYDRLHLGTDYLTTDIIEHNARIAITGNPGVGKSTYARNICYKWAIEGLNIHQTPIYIQLRDLNFQHTEQNILIEYIWFNYLRTITIEEVAQLFIHQHQSYLLVLDGYDELNRKKQIQLEQALLSVTKPENKARYIILSRPYGLLHHKFDKDFVLQIDGFTESSIENYITAFLKKNTISNKNKQELLRIINQNYVLKEYAHIPLMLSYIVLIYLREDKPNEYLSSIKSLYDLQSYIFRWLIDYATGHQQAIEVSKDWKKEVGKLAYKMLMDKEFSYQPDLLHYHITRQQALEFSKLGLGSIIDDDIKLNWRFSFSTVTLQEFLASYYIINQITTEAFCYLIKDQYYWNFSKMILGGLANKKNSYQHIQAIFDILESNCRQHPKSFIRYIYYSLLSETNPIFLNRHLNHTHLKELLAFYQNSYFDATWHPIIQEASQRIYHKLYSNYKTFLHDTLNESLKKIVNKKQVLSNDGKSVVYSLIDIVSFMNMKDYAPFIKTIIKSIQDLSSVIRNNPYSITSLKMPKYEEHPDLIPSAINDEMDILDVIFILFEILSKIPNKNLKSYKSEILQFKKDCPLDNWLNIEQLVMKFQTKKEIIQELAVRIEQLRLIPTIEQEYDTLTEMYDNDILGEEYEEEEEYEEDYQELEEENHNWEETNLTSDFFNIELTYISGVIYKIGASLKDDINDAITHEVIQATNLFLEKIFNPRFRLQEIIPVTEMLIQGLTLINKPSTYDLIFDCVYRLESDVVLQIPNEEAFQQYLKEKFNLLKKEFNIFEFLRLSKALENTWNSRYNFIQYREDLKDLFFKVIKDNQIFLNKHKLHDDTSNEFNNGNLCLLTLEHLIGIPFYAYDRKYFIDRIIKFEPQFDFLKYHAIPMLFEMNFPFYQVNYWNYLFELEKENELPFELLELILNDGIYYYSANLPYLKKLILKWSKIAAEYKENPLIKEKFNTYAHHYLAVISNTLKLMEESGELCYDPEIIQYAGEILSIPYAQSIFNEEEFLNIYDASDLVPYVMQYYYTQDRKYLVTFDYITLKTKHIHKKTDLIRGLIQLFVANDFGMSLNKLRIIRPVLGEDLYQDIIDYIEDHNVLYESILPIDFEQKLRQSA